jgi:signal transduction histidine kinase
VARQRAALRTLINTQHCFVPAPRRITAVNRQLRGWANYFRFGYPRGAFRAINTYTRQRLTQHLSRRSQRPFRPPQGVTHYHAPYVRPAGLQVTAVVAVTVALFLSAWVVLYAIRQVRTTYSRAAELRTLALQELSRNLKRPLAFIAAHARLLEPAPPAQRHEDLARIRQVAQHALGLVVALLDAAAREARATASPRQGLPAASVRRIYTVKCLAYGALVPTAWLVKWLHAPGVPAAAATVVVVLLLLPNLAVARWRGAVPAWLLGVSVAADVLCITAGIHIGGGVEMISGPIAYVVVIGLAGLVLSETAALLAAIGCLTGYGLVALAEHWAILPHWFPSWRSPDRQAVAVILVGTCLSLTTWLVLYAVSQLRLIYRRADELRGEVVSALSHDLKNPLGNIRAFAELADDCTATELRAYVRGMQRSNQQALDLVGNVLDASALDGRPFSAQRRAVDLHDLITEVAGLYHGAAEAKRIHLHVAADGPPILISADPHMLGRAIGNLVSNAIKYTPRSGRVEVTAMAAGGAVTIAVRDSGPGIAADEQDRLFQKYSRTSSAAGVEGTGLGLYIVRRFAEAHGGTVGVASQSGRGSTFTVELPLRSA